MVAPFFFLNQSRLNVNIDTYIYIYHTYISYMYILQYTVYATDIAYGWKIKHERSRDRQGTKTRSSVIENVRVPTNRERLVRARPSRLYIRKLRECPHIVTRARCKSMEMKITAGEASGKRVCNFHRPVIGRIFRPFNFMRSRVPYVNRSTRAYRFEYRARKSNNACPPVSAHEFSRVQRCSILCERVVQNMMKCR